MKFQQRQWEVLDSKDLIGLEREYSFSSQDICYRKIYIGINFIGIT